MELINCGRFGELINLRNGEDFLTAIDQEDKAVTVIILLQVSSSSLLGEHCLCWETEEIFLFTHPPFKPKKKTLKNNESWKRKTKISFKNLRRENHSAAKLITRRSQLN